MMPTVATPSFSVVMAGLVPAIHDFAASGLVDDRVKPGHDGGWVRQ
jgi:hypothetical protein